MLSRIAELMEIAEANAEGSDRAKTECSALIERLWSTYLPPDAVRTRDEVLQLLKDIHRAIGRDPLQRRTTSAREGTQGDMFLDALAVVRSVAEEERTIEILGPLVCMSDATAVALAQAAKGTDTEAQASKLTGLRGHGVRLLRQQAGLSAENDTLEARRLAVASRLKSLSRKRVAAIKKLEQVAKANDKSQSPDPEGGGAC